MGREARASIYRLLEKDFKEPVKGKNKGKGPPPHTTEKGPMAPEYMRKPGTLRAAWRPKRSIHPFQAPPFPLREDGCKGSSY